MDKVTNINIPFPVEDILHLRLALGACRMRIVPGEGTEWVSGSYKDPSGAVPLRVVQDGGTVRISQEFHWAEAIGPLREPPTIEIAVGKGRPFALTLEGGASESVIDLGGVSLRGLEIKYGAGRQEIDFSAPNPQQLEAITLSAGAASVEMVNLANANFQRLTVEGGAARFAFDFGGELAHDAEVKITTGMASVELIVPSSTAARVHTETTMGGLDIGDGWMKQEGVFANEAALAGGEPAITITARVVMGAIELVSA